MNTLADFFGLIATFTSIIGLFPQIYTTYKLKCAQDISLLMLCNYFICSASWVIYGFYTSSNFVVWSNLVGCAGSAISILQKYFYAK